jgi:hypothetical protein
LGRDARRVMADEEDEVSFDLADWTDEERATVGQRLTDDGIAHRWEETELVVDEADADVVEGVLDEVDYPDQLDEADEDEEVDDEAVYAVMSNLYVAADRLKDDPDDADRVTEFWHAAEAASTSPPPFGIDQQVWRQVQEVAGSIKEEIDQEADSDVMARDAASLRQMLSHYV